MGQDIMIKDFQIKDLNELLQVVKQQANEVGAGVGTLDNDLMIDYARKCVIDPNYKIILATKDGAIEGYALCQIFELYYNQHREGNIELFHINQSHRNGFLAKSLFDACEQFFKENDCVYFNASTRAFDTHWHSNEDYLKSADNFYSRLMTPCGTNYIKEINNG